MSSNFGGQEVFKEFRITTVSALRDNTVQRRNVSKWAGDVQEWSYEFKCDVCRALGTAVNINSQEKQEEVMAIVLASRRDS